MRTAGTWIVRCTAALVLLFGVVMVVGGPPPASVARLETIGGADRSSASVLRARSVHKAAVL